MFCLFVLSFFWLTSWVSLEYIICLLIQTKTLISSLFSLVFTRLYYLIRDIISIALLNPSNGQKWQILVRYEDFSFCHMINFLSRLFLETTVTPQWLQLLHSNCHHLVCSLSHTSLFYQLHTIHLPTISLPLSYNSFAIHSDFGITLNPSALSFVF